MIAACTMLLVLLCTRKQFEHGEDNQVIVENCKVL